MILKVEMNKVTREYTITQRDDTTGEVTRQTSQVITLEQSRWVSAHELTKEETPLTVIWRSIDLKPQE